MIYPEVYEEVRSGVYERFYKMKPGDRVVDVGAHVGHFTRMASEKIGPEGRVTSFEPDPENFARLAEDTPKNVAVSNAAVSNCSGSALLFRRLDHHGGHSLNHVVAGCEPVLVDTIALDDIIERVDFIKIDCEGSELHVLYGAKNLIEKFHPPMAMEIHTHELYTLVKKFLEQRDYTFEPATSYVGVCYAIPNSKVT